LHRTQSPFDVAVIGFDSIIAVAPGSLTAVASNVSLRLEFPKCGGIATQTVAGEYIEYMRWSVIRARQRSFQEQLGGLTISRFRKKEVDRLPLAIHGAEQVHPFTGEEVLRSPSVVPAAPGV
jgi:hypothetical protein